MPEPNFVWIDIDQLRPNQWNPNLMSDDMLAKEIESIHRFGFVDPITAREVDDWLEIIDGEHRWKVALDHSDACRKTKGVYVEHVGLRQLPVVDLGPLPDEIAQQLTIVLNETRGEAEPKRMGALLSTLLISQPLPKLLEVLPFTQAEFEELAELPKVDWNAVRGAPKIKTGSEERWVERVYRLPLATAELLDRAIEHAAELGGAPGASVAESIRRIAEEYLNG